SSRPPIGPFLPGGAMRITSSTHRFHSVPSRSASLRRHTLARGPRRLGFEALEPRTLLAPLVWKAATSGNFSVGATWVGAQAPGPNDTAVIDATGADYMVTIDKDTTLAGFTLNSANAGFSLSGRTITVNGPAMLDAGSVTLSGSSWTGTGTLTNNA